MQIERERAVRWAKTELSIAYHDAEWGVPVHDDRLLFEFLDPRRRAGRPELGHDPQEARELSRAPSTISIRAVVARTTPQGRRRLLADPGIVRNRLKIEAAIAQRPRLSGRAGRVRQLRRLHLVGSSDGRPQQNRWRSLAEVPARTPESDAMSRDLLKRGFRFVGPHHLLRLHAGGRDGERPSRLPASATPRSPAFVESPNADRQPS